MAESLRYVKLDCALIDFHALRYLSVREILSYAQSYRLPATVGQYLNLLKYEGANLMWIALIFLIH